ncbi:hypothetical protein K440DRAFT_614567 [Wilcoxina mikolae CBS 423.85]|nr:hypothetical protein K440DRAFT_614567 [Wilcoxina mikolae CBS 423.85]
MSILSLRQHRGSSPSSPRIREVTAGDNVGHKLGVWIVVSTYRQPKRGNGKRNWSDINPPFSPEDEPRFDGRLISWGHGFYCIKLHIPRCLLPACIAVLIRSSRRAKVES